MTVRKSVRRRMTKHRARPLRDTSTLEALLATSGKGKKSNLPQSNTVLQAQCDALARELSGIRKEKEQLAWELEKLQEKCIVVSHRVLGQNPQTELPTAWSEEVCAQYHKIKCELEALSQAVQDVYGYLYNTNSYLTAFESLREIYQRICAKVKTLEETAQKAQSDQLASENAKEILHDLILDLFNN